MSQAPRLELRQGQSLVMTQQLQQSIKLLQCNSLELREFVELELEKNPFLQEESGESEPADQVPGEEPREATRDDGEPRETDFGDDQNFDASSADESWGDDSSQVESDYLRHEQGAIGVHSSGYDADDDTRGIDDNASQGISLREHLMTQMLLEIDEGVERFIATNLIDVTDESGYIKEDIAVLSEQLGAEMSEVENVLQKLQRFDPSGVCARNLSECLALQLRDKNRLDPAMQLLLDNLALLADAKLLELQKRCGVDAEDLRQMITEIRELNPKPGSGFSHELVQAIEPDIFIRRLPDGNWHVELNMGNFPRVMVNKRYYKKVTAATHSTEDKKYLADQFGSANWLVRALEQRAQTMLKVSSELVAQQDAFFRLGVRFLRPMTLKDIAAKTGFHESTISRVTAGKFLICPRGMFELKYFFTSALQKTEGGGDVSSEAVRHHIREMIDKESPEHILSDD
ncbi:MAG: RNA polymerase sigma-54 factor, partial [Alphaproteobacteria bacterium]|nr:RNA polymerase sigma-54 factor [Alphaproteobacteria bacterium]